MATKFMMNTMSALVTILSYGLVVGASGLILAIRERARRKVRRTSREPIDAILGMSVHGRLRTDAGEELEVYLQKAGH
jgi:hypothetical protein